VLVLCYGGVVFLPEHPSTTLHLAPELAGYWRGFFTHKEWVSDDRAICRHFVIRTLSARLRIHRAGRRLLSRSRTEVSARPAAGLIASFVWVRLCSPSSRASQPACRSPSPSTIGSAMLEPVTRWSID
jgi:hypothetical protein